MIENIDTQIDKIILRIPIIVFLVYFIGFLSTSIYVSPIVGSAFDIVNIQYFVTGLLCIVLFLPPVITLCFNYQERTDNANKTVHMIAPIFFRSFFVGYFTIIMISIDALDVTLINKPKILVVISVITIVCLYSFLIDFILTSYAGRNVSKLKKSLFYLSGLILQVVFVFLWGTVAIKLYSIIMYLLITIIFVYLGVLADNKTDLRGLALFPILLVLLISISSMTILPNISVRFGGFKYENITIVLKESSVEQIRKLNLQVDDAYCINNQNIVFDSNDFLIIKNDGQFIKLNKDLFIGYKKGAAQFDYINDIMNLLQN